MIKLSTTQYTKHGAERVTPLLQDGVKALMKNSEFGKYFNAWVDPEGFICVCSKPLSTMQIEIFMLHLDDFAEDLHRSLEEQITKERGGEL